VQRAQRADRAREEDRAGVALDAVEDRRGERGGVAEAVRAVPAGETLALVVVQARRDLAGEDRR
jgi:hypothetical protein